MRKVCYLRVLPQYDGKRTFSLNGKVYRFKRELIKNELLTLTEAFNDNVPLFCLETVKVEKCSVYHFFGARFSEQYPY